MPHSSQDLVSAALSQIETISVKAAIGLVDRDDVQFIDIRDVRELEREGTIPGAYHAPRGMLEFWIDPESIYAKPVFQSGKMLVFFCASAWRSALATKLADDMGLAKVCHIEGGFTAWRESGGAVEQYKKKVRHD